VPVSDMICQAIQSRRALSFRYKGSVRLAVPYILGFDNAGALVLSAVQLSGGSGVGFRTFSVANLSFMTITNRHFDGRHAEYNPRDRLFHRVICQI
jgi:hypothetical protein